jgi:hypothetical protein
MQAHNRPNKYNAAINLLCMNARIGVLNSENLGTKIMENRGLDQKIWALEAFRGKMVFLGGLEEFLKFLKWLEGLWRKKNRALAEFGDFWPFGLLQNLGILGHFFGILDGLEWFRTYL